MYILCELCKVVWIEQNIKYTKLITSMVQDLPHIYILNLNNKDHILPIQIKKIIKKKR